MSNVEYIDTGVSCYEESFYDYSPLTLYGYRVYDGDRLIHDYVPCRNPEGVEGGYDVVGKFFKDRDSLIEEIKEHLAKADRIVIRR